jgi:hypothetical protein
MKQILNFDCCGGSEEALVLWNTRFISMNGINVELPIEVVLV